MQETYFISDTHFFHSKIMQYENRPFNTVEEMNELMIANWNKVIKPEYLVFHLGDVALTGFDKSQSVISRLNGHKFLIKGNHDSHSNDYYKRMGFDEVSDYPIIFRDFYMLSHAPLYINHNMPYVNIHGHLHSNSVNNEMFFNVSVENINYTPINFKKIEQHFQSFNKEIINESKSQNC